MHGSPLSKYDNRDLWKRYDFNHSGILGEAYLSIEGVNYFSDTGRTWSLRDNIRDFIDNDPLVNRYALNTTDDLIALVKSDKIDNFYISINQERWASSKLEWIWCYLKDIAFNVGKRIIRSRRQ